jgi:hypothetical protein
VSSIFIGKSGLRLKYNDLTAHDLQCADAVMSAKLLCTLGGAARIAYIYNSLDQHVIFSVVHPEADVNDPNYRLLLLELDSCQTLNFEMFNGQGMNFDPGTMVFVHRNPCIAPTCGKVRLIHWG